MFSRQYIAWPSMYLGAGPMSVTTSLLVKLARASGLYVLNTVGLNIVVLEACKPFVDLCRDVAERGGDFILVAGT